MTESRALIGGACLAAATLSACENTAEPVPPILLQMERTAIEVVPGEITSPGPGAGAVTYLDFVVQRNGYAGDISYHVSARSVPPGTTPPDVAVLQYSDPALDSIGSVRVTYPSSTSPGTYVYELRATAGELGSVTMDIVVRVTAFRLLPTPSSLAVSRGRTNTLGLTFKRDPLTAISVAATPAPAGVAVAVTNPTGSRGYVDISATTAAATGEFVLRITAQAGQEVVTRDIQVFILAEQPTQPVAFRVCRAQYSFYSPIRYLYANEGSSWTVVTPDSDFMIRFDATDRVAFAEEFWFPGAYASGRATRVMYLTADELRAMQCPPARLGSHDFRLAVTNADQHYAALGAWRALNGVTQASTQPVVADLIATGSRNVVTGRESRMILRRDQDLSDGETISLDFTAGEAVVLDSAPIAWSGSPGSPPSVYLHTATTVGRVGGVSMTSSQYFAAPETLLLPGEVQSLATTRGNVGAIQWFRGALPVSIAFGPDVAAPTLELPSATISLASQSEYPDMAGVGQRFTRDTRGIHDFVEVWTSRAYLGGTPATWLFAVPDLGREGVLPSFGAGDIGAVAVSGSASLFFGGTGSPGTVLRWGSRPAGGMATLLPFPTGY